MRMKYIIVTAWNLKIISNVVLSFINMVQLCEFSDVYNNHVTELHIFNHGHYQIHNIIHVHVFSFTTSFTYVQCTCNYKQHIPLIRESVVISEFFFVLRFFSIHGGTFLFTIFHSIRKMKSLITTVSIHLSFFRAPQHPKKATRKTNPPPAISA